MGHLLGLGIVKQNLAPGRKRAAVIEQQRGPAGQPGNQPVPHHPATSRKVEQTVTRPHIAVQLMLLEVLKQNATVAMDNALGNTGRAGGKHNEERMIECHPFENCRFLAVHRSIHCLLPNHTIGNLANNWRCTQIRHDHGFEQ